MDSTTRQDNIHRALLDRFQRDFPLEPRPFGRIAEQLGIAETEVIEHFRLLSESGLISRVGPVFTSNQLGCSTLVALAVEEPDLEWIAALINQYEAVNHNYEREHQYNLWFVITAPDRGEIDRILADIEHKTGLKPLDLPMLKEFFIDLGFDLWPEDLDGTTR